MLTLAPGTLMRVGTLQYPQTLPLADHEVVLTFDDGPLPPYSNQILDILAANCVKVNYFLVGEMAKSFPAVVRRMHQEGHTLGTHSEDHPTRFDHISVDKVRWEIDQGIANVDAALGDPSELAPFFRIPGLGRTDAVEKELAARSLIVFSVDAVADDWHRRIKPAQIVERAVSRLEARGGGILLLHDIHPTTVAALPELLKQLKAHGFRLVQVVPAPPSGPSMIAGATQWMLASAAPSASEENNAAPDWAQAVAEGSGETTTLSAPDQAAFDVDYTLAAARTDSEGGVKVADAGDGAVPEPGQLLANLAATDPQWPEPSMQIIGFPNPAPRLMAEPLEMRPGVEVGNSHARESFRHGHHHAPRRARAPAAEHKHAGLISTLATMLTPATPAPKRTRTAAR